MTTDIGAPSASTRSFSAPLLQAIRLEKGFTQEDVARLAGCSESWVNVLERGFGQPSVPALLALAAALDVDVADLLVGGAAAQADARRRLIEARLTRSIRRETARGPRLTDDQVQRLAGQLAGGSAA